MGLFRSILALLCCIFSAMILFLLITAHPTPDSANVTDINVGQIFSQHIDDQLGDVLEGILPVRKTYQLRDSTLVAPIPAAECYGEASTPAEMADVLSQAGNLLAGQSPFFNLQTPAWEKCPIRYYLDETLYTVTWKQPVGDCVYTFAEAKIAHASQFRRFFSEGKYGSSILKTPTELSTSVNAVLASSGDFYGYREIGIVVNNGQVFRGNGHMLDTCYIDENGDLLFTAAGEYTKKEAVQQFVDEHNIRFSLSFGPLIIKNGECCVPAIYNSGEINDHYVRAALCQLGPLHYLIVAANTEEPFYSLPTVAQFANNLHEMGIQTAYCLDGGQTAAIILNQKLVNSVNYGSERHISDIIYFATAIPTQESEVSE